VVEGVNANAFFEATYDLILARMIAHVVEVEGPVLDGVLARRIARAHGWQRTGSRIRERVEGLAAKHFKTTEEDVGTFYWPVGLSPDGPMVFRWPAVDAVRAVDEICLAELSALAKQVIEAGFMGESLIATMAGEVGLHQVRAASRTRLEKAMQCVLATF